MKSSDTDLKEHKEDNLGAGAKGGAIAFSLKVLNTALAFLNQIILARILGAGGIGEVILAITIVRTTAQIAKFGMEETMMKFIPIYIDQKDESRLKGTIVFSLKFCLVFSIIFMLAVLAVSKFISINIFHSEGLSSILLIAVIAIPAWVIRDVISGILRGYKDALRALIPESLVSPFFRIIVFLILLIKGVSTLYAVIAFVAGEIMALVVSIIFLRMKLKILRPVKKQCEKTEVLNVAYTIIFTGMSILLYTQADIWILGIYKSTEIVGIYGIAAKLVLLVYFPMMAFGAILPPLISSIHTSGNIVELRKIVSESTRWILSMSMPIILILVLEGKNILTYFYGAEFAAGYLPLVILTAGQMIKAFAGLIAAIMMMTGQHKVYMKITITGGILNLVLNVLLVPRYGMIGSAAATAFCLSMIDIVSIYIIKKRLSVLTLAKGFGFDIVFIVSVAVVFLMFNYYNFYYGQHLLMIGSLILYIWKSIKNNDIPLQLLTVKN